MEDCRIVNDIVVRERGNETEMMCLILYTLYLHLHLYRMTV